MTEKAGSRGAGRKDAMENMFFIAETIAKGLIRQGGENIDCSIIRQERKEYTEKGIRPSYTMAYVRRFYDILAEALESVGMK